MHTIFLELTPSDVAMFREARPFDQVATASCSTFPSPRTIAGAVRTWLLQSAGADIGSLAAHVRNQGLAEVSKDALKQAIGSEHHWVLDATVRGPFLARHASRLYPLPLHIVDTECGKELKRLHPVQTNLPGYVPPEDAPEGFRHLWLSGGGDWKNKEEAFLDKYAMARALSRSEQVTIWDLKPDQASLDNALWRSETRYGIARDGDTHSVEEGALYASEFMRLDEHVAFEVDIHCEDGGADKVRKFIESSHWMKLGGEGKAAWVRESKAPEYPEPPVAWADAQRFTTCLITPGRFAGGSWFPREMAERYTLVSAIVRAPLVFSGWDGLLNRPLKTKCAARMGSVYFWEKKDGAVEGPDPHGISISDDENDRQAGWGICLRGDWDYAIC